MKPRIKIDVSLIVLIIILTGLAYIYCPKIFYTSRLGDNISDFFGLLMILKGNFLRMWARGHKKANSDNSESLVTTGPYTLTRNPMYLGSFYMGSGFVFMAWSWWAWPIFAVVFYLRFKIQIAKEESFLEHLFGPVYKTYCERVPRFFPNIREALTADYNRIFNWSETLDTKETPGLFVWPLLAVFLDGILEKMAFGYVDIKGMLIVLICAYAYFGLACFIRLRRK